MHSFERLAAAVCAHYRIERQIKTIAGSVFYLRADPLGISFYHNDNGVETALTAERQIGTGGHRWSPDGRVAALETIVDSAAALMLYDADALTRRIIPMAPTENGWFVSEERGIL
ncbi:hypothetical protein [Gemmatimonas sp.]|uniref:hypothetical protein n=1 Tax=Gemmatimonas sp. TaxID=1962908 RepID=UPI003566C8B4